MLADARLLPANATIETEVCINCQYLEKSHTIA